MQFKNSRVENGSEAVKNCEFILKIEEMIKKYPDFVRWSPDGSKIEFLHLKQFAQQVLPKFFRHSNHLSFVRQLNIYYFTKCGKEENDQMTFQHPIFYRGNEQNFKKISRKNKTRDDIKESIPKTYKQTFEAIEKQQKIKDQLKNVLFSGIQYVEIAEKGIKQIKKYLQLIVKKNLTARTLSIKTEIANIKDTQYQKINLILQKLKQTQTFIKNELCRDLKDTNPPEMSQFSFQQIISDEMGTCKQIPLMSFRSKNSLIAFGSKSSFNDCFNEKENENKKFNQDDSGQLSIELGIQENQNAPIIQN